MPDPTPAPAPLDYAPRPSPRRRWLRKLRRWWPAGLLMVLAALAILYGPHFWRRWKLIQLQEACMTAKLPGDRVVYENDHIAALTLVAARPTEYQLTRFGGAGRIDPRWAALATAVGPLPRSSVFPGEVNGTMFLHERHTPDGRRRLVMAEGLPWGFDPVVVIEPAGYLGGPPRLVWEGDPVRDEATSRALEYIRGMSGPSRVEAGLANPADPSRFTVPFMQNGVAGTLEYRLGDDEQVTVRLLDPAGFKARAEAARAAHQHIATQPAPASHP